MTLKAAIVQDAQTNRVLMLGWMNDEAERLTRETGEVWFWSRSREELWRKGATSGNTLAVEEIRDDCDGDALVVRANPAGPTCHTGASSCFAPALWRTIAQRAGANPAGPTCHTGASSCFAPALWRTIAQRAAERPEGSYTTELLNAGIGAAARKVGE